MSKNQIQRGSVLDLTAPAGGVVSGVAQLVGGLLAVPQVTLTAAQVTAGEDTYAGGTEGVWELPKEATTAVFTEGETVYWDDTAKVMDETAVGRYPVGTAVKAAISTDATVHVKLKGFAVAAV